MLLRSDLIKTSSEERSLLKNLGSWLGKFTIGRNQALRAKEIDLKVLIIEVSSVMLQLLNLCFLTSIIFGIFCLSLFFHNVFCWKS